jgi:hypothetical protein
LVRLCPHRSKNADAMSVICALVALGIGPAFVISGSKLTTITAGCTANLVAAFAANVVSPGDTWGEPDVSRCLRRFAPAVFTHEVDQFVRRHWGRKGKSLEHIAAKLAQN